MHLPDIDGLELLRHLKDDDDLGSIPVVVVSADATAAHIEAALTARCRPLHHQAGQPGQLPGHPGRTAGRHGHALRLRLDVAGT
jgi:CheY-like chemotaxis protein